MSFGWRRGRVRSNVPALNIPPCFALYLSWMLTWSISCTFSSSLNTKPRKVALGGFTHVTPVKDCSLMCDLSEASWDAATGNHAAFWQLPVREGWWVPLLCCLVKRYAVWSCWTPASSQREKAETAPWCPEDADKNLRGQLGPDR